jgi:hypothetical protein
MNFADYNTLLQRHVEQMCKDQLKLFTVEVDKDILWNHYLNSFPAGTNEVYRTRREFDCSCCRRFVKTFGNVISLQGDKINTIWDFQVDDSRFAAVNYSMLHFVSSRQIENVFAPWEKTFGTEKSIEQNKETKEIIRWEHFCVKIDYRFLEKKDLIGEKLNTYSTTKGVFERSLTELKPEAVETVLDLISQNSLYRGEEWKPAIEKFSLYQKAFFKLKHIDDKDIFLWTRSIEAGQVVAKIRGTSIGTLLIDLSEEMDLDAAVRRYEAVVAPSNYKRPKEIFTKRMIEEAEKVLTEEGLIDSLPRRFAVLEDITVNDILFANRDAMKVIQKSVFDELKDRASKNPKDKHFGKVEEISIDDFVTNVLPGVTNIEAFFENRHAENLMSLIAPKHKDAKSLFKWDNGFSWAYNGNMTDSMKERVKAAGGNVAGCLRFSIQWNEKGENQNDFDAHCIYPAPRPTEIYFANKDHRFICSGSLDVDIIHPNKDQVAVENIIFTNPRKMPKGKYEFFVNCYNDRGGANGFRAEIEFNGQIFHFDHQEHMHREDNQAVGTVEFDGKEFKLTESMAHSQSSKTIWGLKTQNFQPVSVMMFSPNHWHGEQGIGNKHYFFILRGCANEQTPNGFFNEFVREEYMKHKRVFAALGSKMKVDPHETQETQLSGLGFSSTKRNELTIKVEGNFTRTLNLTF